MVELGVDQAFVGRRGVPAIAHCNHSLACTTGRRHLRSRSSARRILSGWVVYRQRAHGACGRESRIAPMTSRTTMNMPSKPVHTLPLSTTTTAIGSVITSAPTTAACQADDTVPGANGKRNINGCRPMINSPATATAAKTASTELRPSSSQ